MKLITSELIESSVEHIFAKKLLHEVSSLTTSKQFSAIDVEDRMMKDAKDSEDSTTISPSGKSNGQIETLNGISPKSNQKILGINKSPLSFDVTVKKVTIPPQWEKLNSSSSSDSFILNKDALSNGIPIESGCGNESDILLSEEEIERSSLAFDFVEDSEKFGLSDSEVDKLLKDVDEKDKPDVPTSTKSDKEKENGIEDSNNETFTATAGRTNEKSGNLADMLLSNFEKQLQSGFEKSIDVNISKKLEQNHVSEKETKTNISKVCNENNKTENTAISVNSDSDNLEDVTLKTVTESLVGEKVTGNGIDIDTTKQDSSYVDNLENESSHSNNIDNKTKVNESYCLSKPDDSEKNDSDNAKVLLRDDAKPGVSEDEDSCIKLVVNNKSPDDSQDEESCSKTDSCENESFSKTDLSERKSGSSDVDCTSKNEAGQLECVKNADDTTSDVQLPESEMKSGEVIEAKGDLGVETKDAEGAQSRLVSEEESLEAKEDSVEMNETSSAVELQDNADVDMDDIPTDQEMPNCKNTTENSIDFENQGEKDEVDSNDSGDFGSPASESNNAQDDDMYEQISDGELTSDSITHLEEKDSNESHRFSTDEKGSEKISTSGRMYSVDSEKCLLQPGHGADKNEDERLVRKRSLSLEDNAESDNKRTKVSDNDSSDSVAECDKEDNGAIEREGVRDISKQIGETKNVEVSEPLKDKTKDESEEHKSDSVGDEKETEENEKKHDVEKHVSNKTVAKEGEVVRTGIKRIHEHVGLIEVKKVRIMPQVESHLNKLSNSEKLQKNSDSLSKVLLMDKNVIQSTNDKHDQRKETDSESVSVSKSNEEEIADSRIDVTKSQKSPAATEDGAKGESEDNLIDDKDKRTSDKQLENRDISDKSESEQSKLKKDEKTAQSSELKNSLPPRSPKSNLDLAIERVVLGITDEEQRSKEPKKLNPMPFVRKLQDNLLKKLSRKDLEELMVQKLCEAVTDRCSLGDTRQRCQTLEHMLDHWRKKVQQLQKQLRDMEMVMKRYVGDARTRKERPIPVKITRSVGLQVHMGPTTPGMLRNRPMPSNDTPRTQGQVRRRANRVSSPVTGTTQNQQSSQSQQPSQQQATPQTQRQTPQIVGGTTAPATPTPVTVQKVVAPGFTKITSTTTPQSLAARPNITTAAQISPNKITKIVPSPTIKPVGRPITSIAAAITTGSATSTVNAINNTVVSTANTLRIASAIQLNNRQPVKPTTAFATTKSGDLKIIDLTDEEDRAKSNTLRTINPTVSTVTANMIATSAVTSGVSITSGTTIQAGSIRVVQPHQLTGTTATTILAPSTPAPAGSRLAYFVPTSGGSVQQRQVLIASSGAQVRPGVMNVQNRQNQLPTLLFKNGAVVPIQQASGTQSVNTTILRPGHPMQAGQLQQVIPTRPGQPIRVAPSLVTTVGRMTTPSLTNVPVLATSKHPAPLPNPPVFQPSNPNWKFAPPKPELKISKGANKHQQGIVLSWNMTLTSEHEEIASYQLYAYQEGTAQPSTTLWKKVGDVKALPLPMACTLTQFMEGHKYHFAVRAVDVHMRVGPFSTPGNIVLTRK